MISYHPLIEGLDDGTSYQDYNSSGDAGTNALILSQQNAGNIAYLKQQLDELQNLKTTVMDNCGNIVALGQQVTSIAQEQADAVNQINNGQPVEISGST
jgi:hypothetical protein